MRYCVLEILTFKFLLYCNRLRCVNKKAKAIYDRFSTKITVAIVECSGRGLVDICEFLSLTPVLLGTRHETGRLLRFPVKKIVIMSGLIRSGSTYSRVTDMILHEYR